MKNIAAYIWERAYPYIISFCVTLFLEFKAFHPIQSEKIDLLIDGIVTLDSIIIGFLGAIIPIVLSMKNESKLVKYVFEKDRKGLFKKYITETIAYGLIDICISLTVYLNDIIDGKNVKQILEFIFIYTFFAFMLSTYRCMTCIIKLIFSSDERQEEIVAHKLDAEKEEKLWNNYGK